MHRELTRLSVLGMLALLARSNLAMPLTDPILAQSYHGPQRPAYLNYNSAGLPHYFPQPYLGGYHAFGTPYRLDYFYRYYGPKFALGRWI